MKRLDLEGFRVVTETMVGGCQRLEEREEVDQEKGVEFKSSSFWRDGRDDGVEG